MKTRVENIDWLRLITLHRRRYPRMKGQDVYKLLYQGILGPEHLISDRQRFEDALRHELASLKADSNATLYESIRPDGRLCRVSLQVWLARGQNIEELADACVKAAAQNWGTKEELISVWQSFLQIMYRKDSAFTRWLEENDYPPVHHSETYRVEYKPAYRLVMGKKD